MGRGGAAAAEMVRFFMTVSIIRRGREIICNHLRWGSGACAAPAVGQPRLRAMGFVVSHPSRNNKNAARVGHPAAGTRPKLRGQDKNGADQAHMPDQPRFEAETLIETQAANLRLISPARPARPLPSSRKLDGSGVEGTLSS